MLLPNRFSRPSSTKFCLGTTSPPRPKRAPWSWPGATSSTTPGADTARRRWWPQPTTNAPLPRSPMERRRP